MAAKSSSHWPITLTNGAVALLNIFLPLALVRFLTLEEMGRYNIFFLYVTLLPTLYFTGGLSSGIYYWAGKYPAAKVEVRQSWTLFSTITLFLTMVGIVAAPWVAPRFKLSPWDLELILCSIPFAMMSSFFEDVLIARGRIWLGAWFGSISNVLRTLSLLVAAWLTRDLSTVFIVFLASVALRCAVGYWLVKDGGEIQWMLSLEKCKNVLRYALPVSLAAMAAMALSHVDQLILSLHLSQATFALYAMGCLSVPPIEIFEMSVNRVLIPRLSEALSAGRQREGAELVSEAISELFRYLLPATVGLIVYAEPIVQMLFTEKYLPAADYLRLFALSYLIPSFPFGSIARARGDGQWILRSSIFFATLCTAVTWLAARQWSAMGALSAVLISQCSVRLYGLFYARKHLGVPYSQFLPLKEMGTQLAIVAVATAVSLATRPLFTHSLQWFFVTGSVFSVIYLGSTYAVALRRHVTSIGPVHVLELAQTLCLGGLERMVYSLSCELRRNPHIRLVAATYDHPTGKPSLVPQFESAGIPLTQWQKGKGFSLRSIYQLLQLVFSEQSHVLHVHDLGPLIYGTLTKLTSLGRVRVVLTLHTLLDIEQNPRYRLYYKVFLHFVDCVVAVSPGVQAGLLELGVPAHRIRVIPNGVPFPEQSIRAMSPTETATRRQQLQPSASPECLRSNWILCLGRLHRGKGQDVVLNVWAALPAEVRSQSTLFFVGQETQDGYANLLKEKIASAPDRHRIVLAGPTEYPEQWLDVSDLFISGSLLEGMPLAPLEAAGRGLPVVLSDIQGHRFLSSYADYFDLQKPEDGAACIVKIVKSMPVIGSDTDYFLKRWAHAQSLRQQWGAQQMSQRYAELFETI